MKPSMRAFALFFGILSLLPLSKAEAISLPDTIDYCGIQLNLKPGAKKILEAEVQKITASKYYYEQMVERARVYFPFVESAFFKHRVPQDLKYLSIQESSLRPNAISSSQAVGFWQFKAPTAREVGLMVDKQIDERRHIFRASEGAALYLSRANFDFSNWVYAVISYYEGPTGAIPHTNPDYFAKKEMTIDENLHWYVLKAIAHKIAYEPALGKKSRSALPDPLTMVPTDGENNLNKFLKAHDIEKETLMAVNPWLLTFDKLPGDKSYYIFITQQKIEEKEALTLTTDTAGQKEEQKEEEIKEAESPLIISQEEEATSADSYPKALSVSEAASDRYASFPLEKDLHYGVEYVLHQPEVPLSMVAMKLNTSLADLILWNSLMPGRDPSEGQLLYLKKPKKCTYHIVQENETLGVIAAMHKSSVRKIQRKNRMGKDDYQLYIGQKLYLKKKKPKEEPIILLKSEEELIPVEKPQAKAVKTKAIPPKEVKAQATEEKREEIQEVETTWVEHKIKEGETLWGIAQMYDTKVEIIKMVNKLPNDNIRPGQVLRILAKKDALTKRANQK